MADFVFTRRAGKAAELTQRVIDGDPAASRLYAIPIMGGVARATIEDLDTLTDVLATAADECVGSGWNRKTHAAADLAVAADTANNRTAPDITVDEIWTPAAASEDPTGLLVCYAAVATPTNTQLFPIVHLDFVAVSDGTQITFAYNAGGFDRNTAS